VKEQQQPKNSTCCCSTILEIPEELPSIEETLKMLAAALEALKTPGLDKIEILRLRDIIAGNCAKSVRAMHKDRLFEEREGLRYDLVEAQEQTELKAKSLQGDVIYELSISVNLLTNLFLAALTTTITIITMAVTFRQKTNNH